MSGTVVLMQEDALESTSHVLRAAPVKNEIKGPLGSGLANTHVLCIAMCCVMSLLYASWLRFLPVSLLVCLHSFGGYKTCMSLETCHSAQTTSCLTVMVCR